MRRDPRAFLRDVIDAGREIDSFIVGLSFDLYTETSIVRSATERQLEIVGEALNRLARLDPAMAARIPELPEIVAFRNVIAHGYDVVNDSLVWRVITEDLPELVARAQLLLDELDQTVDDALAAEGALATELAAYSPTDARSHAREDADDRRRSE